MVVIYADVLFLTNALMDYLLLLITGRFAGIPLHRIRYFKAAVLGGIYSVMTLIPSFSFLNSLPIKLLSWLLISMTAYGLTGHFIKLTVLFGINACALAGIVLILGSFFQQSDLIGTLLFPQTTWLTLIGSLFVGIPVCWLFQSFMHPKISNTLLHTELSIAGKTSTLIALLDTGNGLRDTVTGCPVLIVSSGALTAILPDHLSYMLSSDNLKQPLNLPILLQEADPNLCPKLIPYRALGVSSGMLLTIRAEWIKINNKKYSNTSVALAPMSLGFGYSALWGGEI